MSDPMNSYWKDEYRDGEELRRREAELKVNERGQLDDQELWALLKISRDVGKLSDYPFSH
jgi:hypothetical protein